MVMMMDIKDQYTQLGYVEIDTDSGTGSTILINTTEHRVLKINQDTAYNEFIEFIDSNDSNNLPIVYESNKYGKPPYEGVHGFTTVVMEELLPLSQEEAHKFEQWMIDFWENKKKTIQSNDEFGLLAVIEDLLEYARSCDVNIDLNKATNVMKRNDGTFVITDPYN